MVLIVDNAVDAESMMICRLGGEDGRKGRIGREVSGHHTPLINVPIDAGVRGFMGPML